MDQRRGHVSEGRGDVIWRGELTVVERVVDLDLAGVVLDEALAPAAAKGTAIRSRRNVAAVEGVDAIGSTAIASSARSRRPD
jgi:hypothetical protein